jgi:hypothetical protein
MIWVTNSQIYFEDFSCQKLNSFDCSIIGYGIGAVTGYLKY